MIAGLPKHRYLQAFILLIAVLLSVLWAYRGIQEGETGLIQRPQAGDRPREQKFELTVPGVVENEPVTLYVPSRLLTRTEQLQMITAVRKEIMDNFRGKNPSMDKVTENVIYNDTYQNGLVLAEWKFSPWNIVDPQGKIRQEAIEGEEKEVQVSVLLTCEDEQKRFTFTFIAAKSDKSETEKILSEVQRELAVKNGTKEQISLPDSVMDYELQWEQPLDRSWIGILASGMAAAVLLEYEHKKRKLERNKRRNRMLTLAYPEFVSNLALFIGSGMTLKSAITRLYHAYEKQEEQEKKKQILLEQTAYLLNNLQNGAGMSQALCEFGENTGNAKYKKLSILMMQQLEKGNEEFAEVLNREAEDAFQERKNFARKLGEEAGTKLLFPMMMMLVITLAILMIPAIVQM